MPGQAWICDLLRRTATHQPSGLIIQFLPATDGSGAMSAIPLNPEVLPPVKNRAEAVALAALPRQAWAVYAEASEAALKKSL